tara:strand:+ start:216 stop:1061 length:846 start_codon:yes stop_codon:yes gene_type:complete
MTNAAIHIEQTSFYATQPKGLHTLNGLLNAWLPFKDHCLINGIAFAELYEKHQLSKVDSYHDTRIKRFQTLIQQEFITPLLNLAQPLKIQKALMTSLCQWLVKHAKVDLWQQLLSNRLTFRGYELEGRYEHNLLLTLADDKTITLINRFCFNRVNTASSSQMLFRGESHFTLTFENDHLTHKETKAYADLFEPSMEAAFTQATLDEEINAYILAPKNALHEEEVEILHASRDYYLNKITSQELQQHFISTTVYSEKFKQSHGYDLIKTIIDEKPIERFSLK